MNVVLLYVEDAHSYDDTDRLVGVYATPADAEAEIPTALWVDGEARHPLYPELRWESSNWPCPYYVTREVLSNIFKVSEPPVGPEFGPPMPARCNYRVQWPQQACRKFLHHSGDHDLFDASWTTNFGLITSANGFADSDGTVVTL